MSDTVHLVWMSDNGYEHVLSVWTNREDAVAEAKQVKGAVIDYTLNDPVGWLAFTWHFQERRKGLMRFERRAA